MAEAGTLHGVADEGGWWPAFDTNEQALEMLVRAIERAGFKPGEQVGIALDIAASEFGKGGSYRLGLEGRELDSDGMCEMLIGWIDRYPIVSIEDPLGRGRPAGFRRVHPRRGRARADRRRRFPGHRRRARARRRRRPGRRTRCCSSRTSAAR